MRKVKVGIIKNTVDYDYCEYCFAIIKYKKKYFILKDNNNYSFIGDKIKDEEGRKECIERIIKERTNIKLKEYEEYIIIDEYNNIDKYRGLENFVTFYIINVDDYFEYKNINKEELILVSELELSKLVNISYQKDVIDIMFGTFSFN